MSRDAGTGHSTMALVVAGVLAATLLAGCEDIRPPRTAFQDRPDANADGTAPAGVATAPAPGGTAVAATGAFVPPDFADIPDNEFGESVRRGMAIFTDTGAHAAEFVGNGLSCSNCHLDAGRLADSAPLWGAHGRYPAYREKNQQVNTYAERLQGCFMFSMDGQAPPADGEVIEALTAYSYWMARGAPIGETLPGAGFRKDFEPPQPPSYARGEKVFQENCALCHGADGQGQQVAGKYVFPPLWGGDSFNWGAGMHNVDTAAAFIKYNMPLGRGGSLSDQQAWDVALFMNSHERPQDPRFTGDVATTAEKFHGNPTSQYGVEINGQVLGANPPE